MNGTIGLHGGRLRLLEGQEWYNVWSGDPNGMLYAQKGVLCLDYENWHWYANNSEGGGNSWINLGRLVDHEHPVPYTRQILWFVPNIPLAVGTDVSATVVYRGPDLTLERWDTQVKIAPTGAKLVLDVRRGINSLWFVYPALRPKVQIGATSQSGTGFDIDVLEDGDTLKLDIIQVGSTIAGGQVTLILTGTAYTATE